MTSDKHSLRADEGFIMPDDVLPKKQKTAVWPRGLRSDGESLNKFIIQFIQRLER